MSDEDYKITNFVTGEDVPAGQVTPYYPGEPSSEYIDGWNACMDGYVKAPPVELSAQETADWLEGYEDAERD